MKKIAGSLVLAVFILFQASGQSLQLELSRFSKDTSGIHRYFKLKKAELTKLPSDVIAGADEEWENQILKVPNKKAQFTAFWEIGLYFRKRGFHQQAIRFLENILVLAHDDQVFDSDDCAIALADLYRMTGEPGKSLDVLSSQITRLKEKHNLEELARFHSSRGDLYFQNEEYDKCLEEYKTVDSLCRKLPEEPKGYRWNIWVNSWNTAALTYYKLNKPALALVHYDSTIKIAQRKGDEFMVGLAKGNSAPIYIDMGDYPKAIEGVMYDFRASKKSHEWQSAGSACVTLAEIYTHMRRFDLAQHYLDSAAKWYPPTMSGYSKEAFYLAKSKLAAATGHFEAAYQFLLRDRNIRDSINKVIRPVTLSKAISKANLAEREQKIELLRNKSLLQEKQLELRNVLIGSGIVVSALLLFSSVVYYRRYEQKRRAGLILKEKNDEIESMLEEIRSQHETVVNQKEEIETLNASLEVQVKKRTEELEKKNQELDTFIYRASHDIRRPITTLLGLDNVFRLLVKDPVAAELFTHVSTTAKNMDRMLNKMRLIYELNQIDDSRDTIWIDQFVPKVIIGMEQDIQEKGIDLRSECSNVSIEGNEALLSIVMRKLIENSIQFTRQDDHEKPFIRVACQALEEEVIITVEDNGIGIEESTLPKIFDLYYRGTSRSTGNGLGLYLVRKALERMGGSVSVQSTFGVGTTFRIVLQR